MADGSEVFTTCPKCGSEDITASTTVHESVEYNDGISFGDYTFGNIYRIQCDAINCDWAVGNEHPEGLEAFEKLMLEEHMRYALND